MAQHFHIIFRHGVFRASGDLDAAATSKFWSAVTGEGGDAPLVIDMAHVQFMDSHALRTLMMLQQRREVVVLNPSVQVRQLLSLTGLSSTFGLL
jgi:anti-anti-sigma factor